MTTDEIEDITLEFSESKWKGNTTEKNLSLISLITHDGDDDDGKKRVQSQWVKSDG